MDDLLIGIGSRIKSIRKENKLTISEVANRAGVSNGLISKIENGRTIPSLPVLLELISALGVQISDFFVGVEHKIAGKFIHIPKSKQSVIEKEIDSKGFSYQRIFSKSLDTIGFEAVILTIEPGSKREKVITDAWEFKFIISGSVTYLIDNETVELSAGDSLYFNGNYPHVPENHGTENCVMLVLYFYSEQLSIGH